MRKELITQDALFFKVKNTVLVTANVLTLTSKKINICFKILCFTNVKIVFSFIKLDSSQF